ncbi:bifunctional ADP-dependent NAD(P)H-hydrate dehydratase/NAD(P)H-hydrate epimerase [Kushneria aurantia]|uniref:Bifunctional NAD(P)H-hydrate repair enzyme n=1 Tax=Kushneria aurantia TaxID=504092 RepID=A0ABV6G766_9GAMM|nr:bifunctional ADP-dependent NAD(P)H-hydrate dehydratase/NAD(P)H-hydrate epimerase [Kushneria aurantia]
MNSEPRLYSGAATRELDRRIIASGVPGFALMMDAGRAALEEIEHRWPGARHLCVLCGGGNNGGDGYVVAALARRRGWRVTLIALRDPSQLSAEAAEAVQLARRSGVEITPWHQEMRLPADSDVVVDGLLGTGVSGALRSPYGDAIAAINAMSCPVVALDIPSGLVADSGATLEACVRADLTVTFIARKFGLYTGMAADFTGEIVLAPLALDPALLDDVEAMGELLEADRPAQTLPRRRPTTHKGHCGHLLVVGGQSGFGGSTIMCAETAARLGAGLVSLATDSVHIPPALARCPELMVSAARNGLDIEVLVDRASAVLIGPGLGQGAWGQGLMQTVMKASGPRIVDADGLHLLAAGYAGERRDDWILTPHPGEAAMLLGCSIGEIQNDRHGAAHALQRRYGGVIVLKGAGTLVVGEPGGGQDSLHCYVSRFGNPGMASGGMGDVLGGIIAALLVQGLEPLEAAASGVLIHALAADDAARDGGERGLLASDLASYARRRANPDAPASPTRAQV